MPLPLIALTAVAAKATGTAISWYYYFGASIGVTAVGAAGTVYLMQPSIDQIKKDEKITEQQQKPRDDAKTAVNQAYNNAKNINEQKNDLDIFKNISSDNLKITTTEAANASTIVEKQLMPSLKSAKDSVTNSTKIIEKELPAIINKITTVSTVIQASQTDLSEKSISLSGTIDGLNTTQKGLINTIGTVGQKLNGLSKQKQKIEVDTKVCDKYVHQEAVIAAQRTAVNGLTLENQELKTKIKEERAKNKALIQTIEALTLALEENTLQTSNPPPSRSDSPTFFNQ